MRNSLLTIVLIACTFFIPIEAAGIREAGFGSTAERFIRVELYFGFDRKEQAQVGDEEWEKFLAEEVTPRFPDGFTVISAIGQYRGADGTIVREPSRVVVFLLPKTAKRKSGALIDEIRVAYKKQFRQESVLRLDFVRSVDVDF